MNLEYSFVIPIFNERETLEELYRRLEPVMEALETRGQIYRRRGDA